jgi:arginine exporter protein ArgO
MRRAIQDMIELPVFTSRLKQKSNKEQEMKLQVFTIRQVARIFFFNPGAFFAPFHMISSSSTTTKDSQVFRFGRLVVFISQKC